MLTEPLNLNELLIRPNYRIKANRITNYWTELTESVLFSEVRFGKTTFWPNLNELLIWPNFRSELSYRKLNRTEQPNLYIFRKFGSVTNIEPQQTSDMTELPNRTVWSNTNSELNLPNLFGSVFWPNLAEFLIWPNFRTEQFGRTLIRNSFKRSRLGKGIRVDKFPEILHSREREFPKIWLLFPWIRNFLFSVQKNPEIFREHKIISQEHTKSFPGIFGNNFPGINPKRHYRILHHYIVFLAITSDVFL